MRRWWRAGAGAACSGWNAGTRRLFWWKLSAASQPELWRGRRAEPGRRRPARQHRHRHHQPPHAPSLDTIAGSCSYNYTDPHQTVFGVWVPRLEDTASIDNRDREASSLDWSLEKFLKFVVSSVSHPLAALSLQTQTLHFKYLDTLQ